MKKKRHEKEPNHERWLLSYSDFITLLMIFFIIMYASSTMDKKKWVQIQSSFALTLGGGKNVIDPSQQLANTTDLNNASAPSKTADNKPQPTEDASQKQIENEQNEMQKIKEQLDKYLSDNGIRTGVITEITERGLQVSLSDTVLFDSGSANIKTDSISKLVQIGKIINQMDNYIRIEGHTDNVPISTAQFKSNWELSVIRATTVTELLIEKSLISPNKISPAGYGDTRPIADNSTDQGRSKNRRVNIILLSNKFSGSEAKN